MKIFIRALITGALTTTVLVAPAAMAAGTDKAEEQAEKPGKSITAADRRHPDYVRCRSEPIIGSLARKRRICMTNKEWTEYTRIGSRNSKEFVDDQQPGFMITPN